MREKVFDCIKWCNARSEMEGRTPLYTDLNDGSIYRTSDVDPWADSSGNGYRLPTPEEWEYAARGGLASQRFPWGNSISHSNANYKAKGTSLSYDISSGSGTDTCHPDYSIAPLPYTSPVKSFAPNGYGLYGMVGNVSEWCLLPEYSGDVEIRGGSYDSTADTDARVRNPSSPATVGNWSISESLGFRTICR